jgi:diketogulonate reductase-like aldo/keto reductase
MEQTRRTTILNNGVEMPMLGLGVYDMHGNEAVQAIRAALGLGYRLIDTASMYRNEEAVGKAIRTSGISRKEIFVTSKVANGDQGYDLTLRAFDESLSRLGTDYLDLYLIHWPVRGKRKDTWKALEKIYADGRARSIGVANYLIPFLEELETYAGIIPAVNQVEFSPFLFLEDLLTKCRQQKIQLQAYSPLSRGKMLHDPKLQEIATKYHKTPAQIILRWDIELGVSAIPKSSTGHRLKENLDIFDFSLSGGELEMMRGFNLGLRVVEDPMWYL